MSELSGEGTSKPRPVCRSGTLCRLVDEEHLNNFKHPPGHNPKAKKQAQKRKRKPQPQKKSSEEEEPEPIPARAKIQKISENEDSDVETVEATVLVSSLLSDFDIDPDKHFVPIKKVPEVIRELFLVEMPEDFYQFYEFCKSISPFDPLNALKRIGIGLVGPFDVFSKGFLQKKVENKEAFLRHWRYYFDPPEFQTILTGKSSHSLHFGYWRDEPSEEPVFVAANEPGLNSEIETVAENIFGAVSWYLQDKTRPLVKEEVESIRRKLKAFAEKRKISLGRKSSKMQARQRKVVAKTFHKAGIVVPYNRKSEVGYRSLSTSDTTLKTLLRKISNSDPKLKDKMEPMMSELQEVVRLATIAADESDFGTSLELAHDLFADGCKHVQAIALRLFCDSYKLLDRPEFASIIETHMKNRRITGNLSVLN